MSPPTPSEPPRLSAWKRWTFGLRVLLTVGIGTFLSWLMLGFFAGFLTLGLTHAVPENSVSADWIRTIVVGGAMIIGLPFLMYNWCAIWGLPRIDSRIDSELLKQKLRDKSRT